MKNFEAWKTEVLRYIRFFPDRGAIARELEDHYEDGVKDLLRIGYAEDLARERALTAMGQAEEVGRGLDAAHRPGLGWLWYISRAVCAALMLGLLFWTWADNWTVIRNDLRNRASPVTDWADYPAATLEEGLCERVDRFELTLVAESRSGKVEKAGYTFSIPYAAMYRLEEDEGYVMAALLRTESGRLWNDESYDALRSICMTDSDGRKFCSYGAYMDMGSGPEYRENWDGHVQLWGSTGNRLEMDQFINVKSFETIPAWTEFTCELGDGFTLRLEWEVAE